MVAQAYDGSEDDQSNQTFDPKTGKGSAVLRAKVRTWHLIINNPDKYDATPESVRATLQSWCESGRIGYWCCIYEQSLKPNPETGKLTPHMHMVLY